MVNAINSSMNNVVNFRRAKAVPMKNNENFGYEYQNYQMSPQDTLIYQTEQDRKAQHKRDKWNKAGAIALCTIAASIVVPPILGLITFAALALLAKKGFKKGLKGLDNKKFDLTGEGDRAALKVVDVSGQKSFEQLTLSKEMKKVVEEMKTRMDRLEWLKKKGVKGGNAIMLYGEPGGGKNAYVYAWTKYLQEKYPGSKLFELNLSRIQSKFHGASENNIMEFAENAIKEAQANPDKKFVVFIDEFDSVTRKDEGHNAKLTEAIQNAFKVALVKLTDQSNIQVIAATNKAAKDEALNKMLDEAILNRFAQTIFVPLPNEEQLRVAFADYFKALPSELVDSKLRDKNSSELKSMCKYIAKKSHHASFRDFTNIAEKTGVISELPNRTKGSKITVKDFKQAVKEYAESKNWEKGKIKFKNNQEPDNNQTLLTRIKNLWKKWKGDD